MRPTRRNEKHDLFVAERMSGLFKRMGLNQNRQELERIASCHLAIAHTMLMSVLEQEGRDLSAEDAAKEWIEKFARDFPKFDS